MNKFLRFLGTLTVATLLLGALCDYYQISSHRLWSEKLNLVWAAGLVLLTIFCLLLLSLVVLALWKPASLEGVKRRAIQLRQGLGSWRWLAALLVVLLPVFFLLYSLPGVLFTGWSIRLLIGGLAITLLAVLATRSETNLVEVNSSVFAILAFGSVYAIASYLVYVRNYPFSLFWSEGNRLWDYSISVGSGRYDYPGKLTLPYDSPGRYIVWGILYAIPNTPIWLHRFWDAFVWIAPHVFLGYLIARQSRFDRLLRWGIALWVFLFLYQGPIYTPLVLTAILILLTISRKRWWLALIGVALAGYYASASRWTWMPAPAIWAAILLVSEIEFESLRACMTRTGWKKLAAQLAPVIAVGAVGLAAGILQNADFFTPQEMTSSSAFNSPLLWYRLLPNATYSSGILLGIIAATAPLICLMSWAAITHRWRVDWVQAAVYLLASLATLVVGLVASTKIGGGSNLHNLDMFFITLLMILGVILRGRKEIEWKSWPALAQAALVLTLVLPVGDALRKGEPLLLPPETIVEDALETLQAEIEDAKSKGEVLFMDQRQLLTFGYIDNLPLVAEYEKKYVMEMAMSQNQEYFRQFYADLADQRFKLIISEPLKLVEKEQIDSFGEENNAWVTWVSNPLLCYYKPLVTLKRVQVQILAPRAAPQGCP